MVLTPNTYTHLNHRHRTRPFVFRALRAHFGDFVVDGVCAGLRALKGSAVTWTELLCLVVNPKGGEGFDVGESVDLSGLRLSGLA